MTAESQTAKLGTLVNVSTFRALAATGRGGNWGVWDGARLGVVMGRPGRHLLPARRRGYCRAAFLFGWFGRGTDLPRKLDSGLRRNDG